MKVGRRGSAEHHKKNLDYTSRTAKAGVDGQAKRIKVYEPPPMTDPPFIGGYCMREVVTADVGC